MSASTRSCLLICILLYPYLLLAEPIKIGVVAPFTGAAIAAGDQQWQGASQAMEDINKKGGVNGNKIELTYADGFCEAERAHIAAEKMISRKVVAVIGHNCSTGSLAAAPIYNGANIVMITPSSTNSSLTSMGYQTVFRTCGRNDKEAEVAAHYIAKELKAKKVAIVHDGSVYGEDIAQSARKDLEQLGVKVVLFLGILSDQTDFHQIINQLSKEKPDLVYYGGQYFQGGNLLKNIRESGDEVTFFGSDALASSEFVQVAGGPNMVKGVYMVFHENTLSGEGKKVVKEFEEERILPEGYTLNAYAAVEAIAQAIKETKSRDGAVLAKWLHNNKVDSVIGELEWDAKGDLKYAPYTVYKWNDDGTYKSVE